MEMMIVTGMSGAGKSEAVKCLEDMGFYTIDNLPGGLLSNILDLDKASEKKFERMALVMDIRGGTSFEDLLHQLEELEEKGVKYNILFMDASDDVLVRRFSETRRIHPLESEGLRVVDNIKEERRLLDPIREKADTVLDTSQMNIYDLRDKLRQLVPDSSELTSMSFTVISFGYKYGLPLDADIVMDLRFLPNPYWVKELKDKNGLDLEVVDFINEKKEAAGFIDGFTELLLSLVPCYQRERKTHLTVGLGCTGGRHRSVVMAEGLAESLRSDGFPVAISHRDIDRQ